MFSKWLETQSDNASWDQLIQAVKNIELNDVASDIEQLLLQGEYVTDMISVVVIVGGAQCGITSYNIVYIVRHVVSNYYSYILWVG